MIRVLVDGQEKEISRITYYEMVGGELVERVLTKIEYGARLVWQGIRSCFGGGYWINDKPWINDDTWKNE